MKRFLKQLAGPLCCSVSLLYKQERLLDGPIG